MGVTLFVVVCCIGQNVVNAASGIQTTASHLVDTSVHIHVL